MHFRFRFQQLGGHVHIRVFTGKGLNYTLANSGSLCLYPEEWERFRAMMEAGAKEGPVDTTVDFVSES